jgi:propanol-preferring alcohol dehydrogenase
VWVCAYCRSGRENLCDSPQFTGYTRDGGYATHTVADARFVFPLPATGDDVHSAPLLCAGLIGWRSLAIAGQNIGLYGFGAAAHIIAQVARWQGRNVYAFTSPDDVKKQAFARELGACWAGGSDQRPPIALDCAIIYAPVGPLVPAALASVRKGGRVVCAGIHMSNIPSFPYALLWEERQVVSVANLTRDDGVTFFDIVPKVGIKTETITYPLAEANAVPDDLTAIKAAFISDVSIPTLVEPRSGTMPLEVASIFILCGIVLAFLVFGGTLMWADRQTNGVKK